VGVISNLHYTFSGKPYKFFKRMTIRKTNQTQGKKINHYWKYTQLREELLCSQHARIPNPNQRENRKRNRWKTLSSVNRHPGSKANNEVEVHQQ